MLLGLISPALTGSKIDEIIELMGQSHHILSINLIDALNKHDILNDIFGRDDMVVQARDLASHRGFQEWHLSYDNEIVSWLVKNKTVGSKEFLNYLRNLYETSEMQYRFPDAWLLIQMAIEELPR